MIHRICIDSRDKSSEAIVTERKLKSLGYPVALSITKVYTIEHEFSEIELAQIADALHNPIVETVRINTPKKDEFSWALELGYLPGVTDNAANTATQIIEDLKIKIGPGRVFTSKVLFINGCIRKEIERMAGELINVLIERFHLKSYDEYKGHGMDRIVPVVKLKEEPRVQKIDLEITDEDLSELGKRGIIDEKTDEHNGPLALDLAYLHAIRDYFRKEGRKPTDIELESIAQTWSEHCKHTIFSSEIDDIREGIFDRYIKGATDKIRKEKGRDDFCLSVFKDNSGAIVFDDEWMVTDKAETHNSPSALDPFGGAITGIVGVNRDTIGFGLGAMPIVNKYGYCFGNLDDASVIYRGKNKTNQALPPKRIMEGVIAGVNSGGNQSGIPTPTGWCFFDDHYKGKPLIFVGTIGLMPRILPGGQPGHRKKAQAGDNVVIVGGRVGKDGIHGATFSSEAMDEGSPATAVQIGDPITQKKLSDAIIKEARDKMLYNSITDNGAGGLSCSVAEMAQECGGFEVELDKVLLKYPGLHPWEIWISESQERMTLSVPDKNLHRFMELMKLRGVEASVIGKFNSTNRGVVTFRDNKILDLDMEFLHNGLPDKKLTSQPYPYKTKEPKITVADHLGTFERLLGSPNICSYEFISRQYDHEVQNNSVIKPLVGKGRVNSTAQVVRPILGNNRGIVMSEVVMPRLSEISCYDMALCTIDTAIRNSVAVGGDVDHMALLDNFCWCSSDDPIRLAQLKDAARGCFDASTVFQTPFISGKDSMFNDFKGFDENDRLVKISVHPTLMISTIGIVPDIRKTITFDFKLPGDLVYVIGRTMDECGGSEFYNIHGKIGANSPKLDVKASMKLYRSMYGNNEIFSACASVSQGGLLIWLAKMAIAGQLGCCIDISRIPAEDMPPEIIFYSETLSRFIVTIDPDKKIQFEKAFPEASRIGIVTERSFTVTDKEKQILNTDVKHITEVYTARFGQW